MLRIGGKLIRVRLEEMGPGVASAPACPTLAEFAAEYLSTRARAILKPSSLRMQETALRVHVLPGLGARRLDSIGARDLAAFQARLLAGDARRPKLTPKSTNNVCSALRVLLRYAAETGVIGEVPNMPHLKTQLPEIEALTAGQAADLLGAATGDARMSIALALFAGLRIGEICALRWASVDLDHRLLTVRTTRWKGIETSPKSNKDRRVELAGPLAKLLASHPQGVSPYVLCRPSGEPFEADGLKWPLWNACDAAALPRIRFHALRHTCASLLVERGVPLRVVQRILGHSTVTMTERYAHVAPRQIADAVSRLDDLGGDAEATDPDK